MNGQWKFSISVMAGLMFLSANSNADSINSPVKFVTLTSDRGQTENSKLSAAIQSSNKKCFDDAETRGNEAGAMANAGTSKLTGDLEIAKGELGANQLETNASFEAQRLCESALKICGGATAEALKVLEGQKASELNLVKLCEGRVPPDTICAVQHREKATTYEQDIAKVNQMQSHCKSTYGYRYASAGGTLVNSVADAQKIDKTVQELSTTGKSSDKMSTGMAVGLGAVGALALKSIFSDGGGGGGGGSEDLAKAAAADPQCQSARAYEFDHCQKYMREYLCNNPATMNDARCEKWSNNYCGFGTPKTDGNGSPVAAPGLGTQVCKDNLAYRYCQKAERVGCYSCLNLRDRAQPTCQRQPAACATTVSDADMGRYRAQCPDDPVFTDPRWAGIQASTGTTPAGQPPTTNTVSGNSVGQNSSANSIIGGGGQRQTSSVNGQSVPDDIGGRFNGSVLAQASGAYKSLCDQGQLNNCGPRANINR